MEIAFHDRARVGVDDFVLLENYTSIDAFVDNLKKRNKHNIVYTNIGDVLISVNPYKELPLYSEDKLKRYKKSSSLWLPPHIFGLVDNAFRSLLEEHRPQCILISGESGSGKTEASKKVLQYIAEVTGHTETMENIKIKLLQSNPLLEAFGNAKTNKNDNSSRFGKYMDVKFNFLGVPIAGKILNYLLEKSRVAQQNTGERNFHIFYQMLCGCSEEELKKLGLSRGTSEYAYLNHTDACDLDAFSDAEQFKLVKQALDTIEVSSEKQDHIFEIVASILHLGNVKFVDGIDSAVVETDSINAVLHVCELLGCTRKQLEDALTSRKIEAALDMVTTPLNREQATYARDALAKAIYSRLFNWLVQRVNQSLNASGDFSENDVLGILDIYGFEVFQKNSYEQFCINYCNEKLQQLFIELTLKAEQEEYYQEGIEWVQVEYFNNKIICELIEEKHKGIIEMLNEECLRPGETNDHTFLNKMNQNLSTHKYYVSHLKSDPQTQKVMERDEFRLKHYAGEVIYNVNGFMEKNKDMLFRDLVELMAKTTNPITKSIFTMEEVKSKKMPDTAINHFKNSLNQLMDTLMHKDPSYIRCIKPNDHQRADLFDDTLVKHQVTYLGLMSNLKVKRAGFAYKRPYEVFLQRYKGLSSKTWPNYRGSAKQGVKTLLEDLKVDEGAYALGRTKVFIRSPATIFHIEDEFQKKKHDIATIIQKNWKGRQQRLEYQKTRASVIEIQRIVRGFVARRRAERRRRAANTIREFIEGYITRYGPETDINRKFVQLIKAKWLMLLSKNLPKSVLDKYWPPCPRVCREASEILRKLYMKQLARIYCTRMTPEKKKKFQEKVLAEHLFQGRKKLYPSSVPEWFVRDRLNIEQQKLLPQFKRKHLKDETVLYSTNTTKYDRHGYKLRDRVLLFTNKYIYLADGKTFKLKHRILYNNITELTVTTEGDNFLLVRISPELKKDKGDLILSMPNLIEAVTVFVDLTQNAKVLKVTNESKILHYLVNGKPGTIKVVAGSTGSIPEICKNKSGHLIIMG